MKNTIRTVCGDIAPETLGFCDTHTHLLIHSEYLVRAFSPEQFAVDRYWLSTAELRDYRDFGGKALIDAQPVGTGRCAAALRQASAETGVHIIASTGFHQRAFYPDDHWVLHYAQQQLADLFIDEINVGMFDSCESCEPALRTDARAGIIKCATKGESLNPWQEKLLGAAADASLETGAPIMCHTEDCSERCTLLYLIERGVPADSIIAAHTDRRDNHPPQSLDNAYALGAYLSFDTFGADYYQEEATVQAILAQIAKGHVDRMLIGLDPVRKQFRSYADGMGLRYIPGTLVPRLLSAGASEAEIRQIMCENPAKVLAFYR